MRRSFGIFVGFALGALVVAGDAQAQNYFQTNGGFYFSGRGGLSQVRSSTVWDWGGWAPTYDEDDNLVPGGEGMNSHTEYRSLEMDYGYVVGVALGYSFVWPGYSGAIRIEGEAMYRKHDDGQVNSNWIPTSSEDDSDSLGYETVEVDGKMDVATAMFNVLMDIHTGTRFTPYIGLGAGLSRVDTDGFTVEGNRAILACGPFCEEPWPFFGFDDTFYALSWQAILGVSFQMTQSLALTLEARHFRLAADRWSDLLDHDELDNVTFDDWSMGFRVTF